MAERRPLVFVCAHLCDERLYAPQLAALLLEKWARLAPELGLQRTGKREYAMLWQRIERLLAAAAER